VRLRLQNGTAGQQSRFEASGAAAGEGVTVSGAVTLQIVRRDADTLDFVVDGTGTPVVIGTATIPAFMDRASLFITAEPATGPFGGGFGGTLDAAVVVTSTCPPLD
jgi:hypothetical protein